MMKKYIVLILSALVLMACKQKPKSWQFSKTIKVAGVNPIGIAQTTDGIWLSDGDHKRIVRIDASGKVVEAIDSLERPMHIAANGKELVIPLYGEDAIVRWEGEIVQMLQPEDSLDAPAGVWSNGDEMAIADFYNHRILYTANGVDYKSFGKEGNANGAFYYPTDVQITKDHIWVADAYNNRVQRFDKNGNFQKMIGEAEKMNAATGIFVSDKELFVTDFENNRVLVYDHDGNLQQEISDGVQKPTDILISNGKLYIANYRTSELLVFEYLVTPEISDGVQQNDHHNHEH
mgnify:CR=1 FL=1